jgi:hypothetical protein
MESSQISSLVHQTPEVIAKKSRSRVTNGKRWFVERDGRGPWARRWRDIIAEMTNDLGGFSLLSESQKQLIRRCATIALACERAEAKAAHGEDIDFELFGKLTDRLGRAFERLGLERVPRSVNDVIPPAPASWSRLRSGLSAAEHQPPIDVPVKEPTE